MTVTNEICNDELENVESAQRHKSLVNQISGLCCKWITKWRYAHNEQKNWKSNTKYDNSNLKINCIYVLARYNALTKLRWTTGNCLNQILSIEHQHLTANSLFRCDYVNIVQHWHKKMLEYTMHIITKKSDWLQLSVNGPEVRKLIVMFNYSLI